jgi:hypothetical protein
MTDGDRAFMRNLLAGVREKYQQATCKGQPEIVRRHQAKEVA